jgi:hypothetical protein
MSKRIIDLEEATSLNSKDQFIFYSNSQKKAMRVDRDNMLLSSGVKQTLDITGDTVPPEVPGSLTITTAAEIDRDGTEKVYIKASIAANSESDLDGYIWSIRRVSGTPTFVNGVLSGYVNGQGQPVSQIFGPVLNFTPKTDIVNGVNNGLKMSWDVRGNTYYEVKVLAVDISGNRSAFTDLTTSTVILSAKDTIAPNAPTEAFMTSAIKSVFITWVNPTEADFKEVKIYRSTTNTAPTIGTTAAYASIQSSGFVDEETQNTVPPTTYYYWLTSVDYSGNETGDTNNSGKAIRVVLNSETNQPGIQPGLVKATDITTFAVDATKMFTNTVILKGDVWTDNSNNGVLNSSGGSIHWNAHTLVYGGNAYEIVTGFTNLQFVYWRGVLSSGSSLIVGESYVILTNSGSDFTGVGAANNNVGTVFVASGANPTWGTGSVGSLSYSKISTNPTLADGQFMIATNVGSDGNPSGLHDLAWNALANAVIGTAFIQNAAITDAKIESLAVDKIVAGNVTGKTFTLIGDSVIRSSSATNIDTGSGLWIKGQSGGGAEFGIGDLAGTNYGYLKYKSSTDTLEVKGSIAATSLTLVGTAKVPANKITSTNAPDGFDNLVNYSPADQARFGIQASIEINSGGISMSNGGFIKAGFNYVGPGFTTGSNGFYLGYTNSKYEFFIGQTGTSGIGGTNYLHWNGETLKIGGNIVGGTTVGANVNGGDGLVINSPIGIRTANPNQTLTITGGVGNGNTYGAQIDFSGVGNSDPNKGVLMLQGGGYGDGTGNGRVEIRTGTGSGGSGVIRAHFRNTGEFIVYRNGADAGAGCGQFYGNLSVGGNFENPNNGVGKLWVTNEIALYSGNNQSVTIQNTSGSGIIYLRNGNPDVTLTLNGGSGAITAVSFTTSSSKRFKTKIRKLKIGIDTINSLKPISYERKGVKNKIEIGLIAEEVNKLIPDIVKKDDNNNPEGIDYSKLTVVLINAVKELSLEIEALKKKIKYNADPNKL